ncbi:hypothetical protein SAMN04487968_10916 [Nocardioides terrae]|uniref:Uncharacterized protein n=1 Tax=Nocardioides terrae TaxID=574651 RepID=A0A1I1L027_9ACTN|nr:hypothetical protein [Nocardioides terrae]SFC64338.1 hypothetical protein SAMN04487968_10916 [Nocardioides terrae]
MRLPNPLVGLTVLLGIRRAVASRGTQVRQELRYRVPPGQDPAAALAAVREQQLEATIVIDGGYEDVVIVCDADRDRERVRRTLRNALVDLAGAEVQGPPIRFVDELPDA